MLEYYDIYSKRSGTINQLVDITQLIYTHSQPTCITMLNYQKQKLINLFLLAPLILLPDLLLLAWSEVVLDVEGLPYLLWCLALDHVCHGLAGHVKKTLKTRRIKL